MLLLPFLPITALIMQNATTLSTLLTYQVLWLVWYNDTWNSDKLRFVEASIVGSFWFLATQLFGTSRNFSTLLTYQVMYDAMMSCMRRYLEFFCDYPAKRQVLVIFYKLKVCHAVSSDFLFFLARGWKDWSQSRRCHSFGEVHHQHAKGAIWGYSKQISYF